MLGCTTPGGGIDSPNSVVAQGDLWVLGTKFNGRSFPLVAEKKNTISDGDLLHAHIVRAEVVGVYGPLDKVSCFP
jgi:hypothetical protein